MNAYQQYKACLRKLNQLILDGEGEELEAEGLRDEMDNLWERLSPEEIKRLREHPVSAHRS